MTRYVILGAGAVGGSIGGRLARVGHDVVFVARGPHADALRERGLTLRTPDETFTVRAPVWAGPAEADLQPDDVLVVATKTQHVQALLADWADLPVAADREPGSPAPTAGERLPWLFATNGVAAERIALRYARRVFAVCVWLPAAQLLPGEVIARFTPVTGVLHMSRYPATLTDDADRGLLAQLETDWESARLDVELPDDAMPWKYRKLLTNLSNALDALLGVGRYPDLLAPIEAEARAVLASAGIDVVDDATERAFRQSSATQIAEVPGAPDELGSSTWQSMTKRSGSVETDYINGEIALIAAQLGIQAPLNARLARLSRQAAGAGVQPGEWTAARLAAELGIAT